MTGINKRSTKPGNGQSKIKDYSSWRISKTDTEIIDGKPERISKSWTDTDGILEDIMKNKKLPKAKGKR